VTDRTPQEQRELIVALAKGDKGEPGERGEPLNRATRRALIYLFAVAVAIGGANLYWTSREVGQQRTTTDQLRTAVVASCGFAADLASAPVVAGPTGKASQLGVKIVSDSRVQWRGLGCPGHLAPPQPSFVKWAKVYHLPWR
jgi:hypothetical protein